MIDSMDIYKSLNNSKNSKMLKFIPDHLKTKKCGSVHFRNYLIY